MTDWNEGAERMLGYAREEALGMPVSAIRKPEARTTLEHTVARLCRGPDVARFKTEHVRNDGAAVEVAVPISAIRDSAQRATGISSMVRDITGQKRSDRRLAEERT